MNRSKTDSIFDWDSFERKCILANIKAQIEDSKRSEKENLNVLAKNMEKTLNLDIDSSSTNLLLNDGPRKEITAHSELSPKNWEYWKYLLDLIIFLLCNSFVMF